MSTNVQRAWLSPFVAITYLAVSITGVMILLHMKYPGVYPIHKWGGILFMAAGIIHLLLNWRVFTAYLKRIPGVVGLVAGVALVFAIAVAVPSDRGQGGGHGNFAGSSHYSKAYRQY